MIKYEICWLDLFRKFLEALTKYQVYYMYILSTEYQVFNNYLVLITIIICNSNVPILLHHNIGINILEMH